MKLKIRFFIDPETDESHCLQHGISAEEVIEAFEHKIEDCASSKDTRIAIGRNSSGKVIKIIYSVTRKDVFVITAYPLGGKELRAFRRRQK